MLGFFFCVLLYDFCYFFTARVGWFSIFCGDCGSTCELCLMLRRFLSDLIFLVLAILAVVFAGRYGACAPGSCILFLSCGWMTILPGRPYCSKRKVSSLLCWACLRVVEHCFIWFLRSRLRSS